MKRILSILAIIIFLFTHATVMAAGSVTQTLTAQEPAGISTGGQVQLLTFSFTAASDDGTVPSTATSTDITAAITGMCIYEVITNPGATKPTDNYDIVLEDADGVDMMGGTLADRDETNSERAVPLLMTTKLGTEVPGRAPVNGPVTLKISGNNAASATGTVKVFFTRCQ